MAMCLNTYTSLEYWNNLPLQELANEIKRYVQITEKQGK